MKAQRERESKAIALLLFLTSALMEGLVKAKHRRFTPRKEKVFQYKIQ
jgi:hypothetical protein